jgi:hypothetical protein
MVRQKLTIPGWWQAVGMHNGGFSHRIIPLLRGISYDFDQKNYIFLEIGK